MSAKTDRPATAPSRCPFCQSAAITTAGQKVTTSSYWRCESCGQLWHPDRSRAQAPIVGRRPW